MISLLTPTILICNQNSLPVSSNKITLHQYNNFIWYFYFLSLPRSLHVKDIVNVPKIDPCVLLDKFFKLMVMYVLPTDSLTRQSGSPTPFGHVAGGYFTVDCVRKSYFFQFIPPAVRTK